MMMKKLSSPNYLYSEFNPPAALSDFIQCYWYLKIFSNTGQTFEIIPDGYFDILFIIQNDELKKVICTGLWNKTISSYHSKNSQIVGIRCKPIALNIFHEIQIADLLNTFSEIDCMNLNLNDEIFMKKFYSGIENSINYLSECIFAHAAPLSNTFTNYFFRLSDNKNGLIRIADISKEANLSVRQCHRQIKNLLGLSPKEYLDIIRFRNSLENMSNIINDYYGYYDQSHYIKCFKKVFGVPPEKIKFKCDDRFLQYKMLK